MEYGIRDFMRNKKEYGLDYALRKDWDMTKLNESEGLARIMATAGGAGLFAGIIALSFIFVPIAMYARHKLKKIAKEKYGRNLDDLNDEEYHALMLIELYERKTKGRTPHPNIVEIKQQLRNPNS